VSPESAEEEAVKWFGDLLNRIQVTASGTGPFLSADEFAEMVRGLLSDSPMLSPISSPLDDVLWVHPDEAEAVLNRAFKVWVNEVRPKVSACGLDGPMEDACVLLGQVNFSFEQTTSGPMVSGGQVEIYDDERPILLHTRLLQELLFRTSQFASGEGLSPLEQPFMTGPQNFLPQPFAPPPPIPGIFPPAPGPLFGAGGDMGSANFVERPDSASYAVVAAGICKSDDPTPGGSVAGLKTQAVSVGLVLATFENYTQPDGTFQYIVKALPFVDAAARKKLKLVSPAVMLDSFTPEGILLYMVDQGTPLRVTALKGIQLVLEISLYRIA
jgi:hypothetical protein